VLVFIFWIGVYPVSFTGKTEASVRALITRCRPGGRHRRDGTPSMSATARQTR